METDQKLADDEVAGAAKVQDGDALLEETSMALQYGMHTPSEVAEAARAACDEVLKLSNIDDNASRSVRPDRDMLLQRSKSKRHSKKRHHKKDKKHKKEKRRSHRKGAQISGDYGARAEHKVQRHTISMGSAPQQVRHGMDVQQISLSTIYKHGVTRHTSEKPKPGFTPRPTDCVIDSIRRHKSQHQEVRRIRPRSSKKLAPIHHHRPASSAFDADSLEVSDSILHGAAAAPSSRAGADNSADEATLAISRSQSDMSTGFNFGLKRSSTDLNKIASAFKQINPLPPHLIARTGNSAGPPSSPMVRRSPDIVPAARDWKKSRRARSPPPMLARSGHNSVESAQSRFNLNVNSNYPVPIDRRHDRRHAFSNDTNAAKAATHFESKQDTSRKVENFSRTPSPTEDTENDVAGLFVRAPNGLCMDFDALSEEVSFIDNSTDFRAAAASADPGSAEELVGHFNSFPKQ